MFFFVFLTTYDLLKIYLYVKMFATANPALSVS